MGDDRGRYLTNLEGFTHEMFGGDPEEIVLRVAQVGEGASSLRELARGLREEAARYERLQGDGWRLVEPFHGGEGRCRKAAEAGEAPAAGPLSSLARPPEHLQAVVEGADRLSDAAARLRAAAEAYEHHENQSRLTEPVRGGHVPLD